MSELEELKARAVERRKFYDVEQSQGADFDCWEQAEDDLDRAIAIAESHRLSADAYKELHWKALAAAKTLREVLGRAELLSVNEMRVLADTAWLEEHRIDG